MDNSLSFINKYADMIDAHMASIKAFLSDKHIRDIGEEYSEAMKSHPETPFNVFTMASDLYYRENFHSDIIKTFLNPSGNHNEGSTFLFAFINFLNDNFGDKVHISKQDYSSTRVEREYGGIDILISSEVSKHCIIIENKLYNAQDMERQLPRYYDFMTESGYTVDAIVYLPLDADKQPNQSDWTKQDKQHVNNLLCIVPAYQRNGMNFVNGWLEPCSLLTKNIDCISVLRQYGELIKISSKNIMDNVILEKFYEMLIKEDNIKTAQSISNMLSNIPSCMKDRLLSHLRNAGYASAWSWKPEHCGLKYGKDEYKIDIWSSVDGYLIQVFCQNYSIAEVNWSEELKDTLNRLHFIENKEIGRFENTNYSFADEARVLEDVKQLAKCLSNMLANEE